jgi:uncharacterized membrane protein YkvA (DUF1232 family)
LAPQWVPGAGVGPAGTRIGDFVPSNIAFDGQSSAATQTVASELPSGGYSWNQTVTNLSPGATYMLSGFFNPSGLTTGNLYLDMNGIPNGPAVGSFGIGSPGTLNPSGWFFCYQSFVATASTMTVRMVRDGYGNMTSGVGYIDDVAITPLAQFAAAASPLRIVNIDENDGPSKDGRVTFRVSFSSPIDAAGVTADNFQVFEAGPGGSFGNGLDQEVPIESIQLLSGNTLVEITTQPLSAGVYQLRVNESGITDRAANLLGNGTVTRTFDVHYDSFSTSIDSSQFTSFGSGTAQVQNGSFFVQSATTGSNQGTGLSLVQPLQGDFDVEVDFSNFHFDVPGSTNFGALTLSVISTKSTDAINLDRRFFQGGDLIFADIRVNNQVTEPSVSFTAASGELRIARVGGDVSLFYRASAADPWSLLADHSWDTDPVALLLYARNDNDGGQVSGNFEDFRALSSFSSPSFVLDPVPGAGAFNLVPNGGFETGSRAPEWVPGVGLGPGGTELGNFVISSSAFDGRFSAATQTIAPTLPTGGYAWQQTITGLVPGATYVLSGFFNTSGLSAGDLYLDMNDIPNDPGVGIFGLGSSATTNPSNWFFCYQSFVATGSTMTVRMVRDGYGDVTSGVGYIDDVAITPLAHFAAPTNLHQPVSWWKADGNAVDSAGSSNGTLENGVTFAPGKVGQAFSFDGVESYVDVPNPPMLTSAISVEAWIAPEIPLVGVGYFYSQRSAFESEGFSVGVVSDGAIEISLRTTTSPTVSGTVLRSPSRSIMFGAFQNVVASYDSVTEQVALYVNGARVPLTATYGPTTLSGQLFPVHNLFIGRRQDDNTPEGIAGAAHYKGLVDELRVFNRTLTAEELQAIAALAR